MPRACRKLDYFLSDQLNGACGLKFRFQGCTRSGGCRMPDTNRRDKVCFHISTIKSCFQSNRKYFPRLIHPELLVGSEYVYFEDQTFIFHDSRLNLNLTFNLPKAGLVIVSKFCLRLIFTLQHREGDFVASTKRLSMKHL